MELARLVDLVGRVRETPRKSEKVRLLADFLRQTQGRETELTALYLSGTLRQGKIGLGWLTMQPAMTTEPAAGEPPSLLDVDRAFEAIDAEQGPGSFDRKVRILRGLLERADGDARRFLVELVMGELRQGALEGLLLDAIAQAAALPPPDVRQAAMFSGSVGELARVALTDGAAGLARFSLRVLSPVAPMLANPAADIEEALERLGEAAFEYKLDGARIQVHKAGDEVR